MHVLRRKLWRDVWHLRGPFAAVLLVVASGVALFVDLRSMHGFLLGTQARYYREHHFADVFAGLRHAPLAIRREIEAIPGVALVEPRLVADVLLDVPGLDEPATGRVVSLPDGDRLPAVNVPYLRSGRYPDSRRRDEILVSDAFARANRLPLGATFGALLHGRWQRLRVVGTALSPEFVYEIRGAGDVFPDNRHFGALWMRAAPLSAAFDLVGACNDIVLTLAPGASVRDVEARLDRVLAPYGGLGSFPRADQISHRFLSDEIAETAITSVFLPVVFLGVTAFLVHLVLSRLVGTQREQIAVLKAFGFADATIGAHYLGIALGPVLGGSILGAAAGVWLATGMADLYARFYQFPPAPFEPDPRVLGVAVAIGAGSALAGALLAVRRVVVLPPAEAMRPEAPARFRVGLLERLGLARWLPATARMVFRNVERRPLKSVLSVLGIAAAVAIVAVGRYAFDAVDWMKDVQFRHVQREDVMVTFREPLSSRAQQSLLGLPGVLRVEPFRAAAVRLVSAANGTATYRTALLGLRRDGELRRPVGQDYRAVPLPPSGVLLTRALADRLGLAPGDRLRVELLEGTRHTYEQTLAGVVDELIGVSATMDLGALHRMLGESDTVSGAFLQVDARQLPLLYTRLKRLPAVSAASVRSAVRLGFERTIAQSFAISLTTTIGFACVIAFGMVYNGARVALSERGRELASLRVLGFDRGEVTAMLLGEQALLVVAALPLGFLLAYALCAVMVQRFTSDLFRMPLVLRPATLAFAGAVVVAAAIVSGLIVRRRLDGLDLVAVLKTRE